MSSYASANVVFARWKKKYLSKSASISGVAVKSSLGIVSPSGEGISASV